MKKFDFEMCEAGHPVVTEGGSEVRIICTDRNTDPGYPIVALVGETEDITKFSKLGLSPSGMYQLVMVPEPAKRYVNIFTNENGEVVVSSMFKTTAEAAANMRIQPMLLKFIRRDVLEFKV